MLSHPKWSGIPVVVLTAKDITEEDRTRLNGTVERILQKGTTSREEPATTHIPIIVLTANAMTSDRERALEAGCVDYQTKPVDFERLSGKIAALLA